MRVIMGLTLAAVLASCGPPAPLQPDGPAPLPAHPVPNVSQPTSLPPVGDKSASSGCSSKDGCGKGR